MSRRSERSILRLLRAHEKTVQRLRPCKQSLEEYRLMAVKWQRPTDAQCYHRSSRRRSGRRLHTLVRQAAPVDHLNLCLIAPQLPDSTGV